MTRHSTVLHLKVASESIKGLTQDSSDGLAETQTMHKNAGTFNNISSF